MLYLEVRLSGRTHHWPLPAGQPVIGRAPECDIVVDDPSISRRHLRLSVSGDGVEIEDLASTNGLWIDGARVERASLRPGEWFSTGSLLFAVREGVSLSSLDLATSATSGASPGPSSAGGSRAALAGLRLGEIDQDTPSTPDRRCEQLLHRLVDASGTAANDVLDPLLEAVVGTAACSGGAVLAFTAAGSHVIATFGAAAPDVAPALVGTDEPDAPTFPGSEGTPALVLPIVIGGTRAGCVILHPAPPSPPIGAGALVAAAAAVIRSQSEQRDSVTSSADAGRRPPPDLGFLATSESGRDLLVQIDRLAATSLPVLLAGESGTGKELLAHRLHRHSRRSIGPFIALNCSAFSKDLVEAELFGIQRGVATGVNERTGRFAQASGGTLLLDEIGDLPLELQPKLLRALEAGEVLPVGAPHPVKVDVRVVSATHMDLRRAIAEGRFRQDLLFRLAGAEVLVPPLRQRPEDILPLARHFARESARGQARRFFGIELEAAKLLLGYSWPGNVRELKHVIARAVALADGAVLHTELLPAEIRTGADLRLGDTLLGLREDWKTAADRFGRLYFTQLVERCGANLSEAARIAGIGRSTLYAKLQELGIDLPER